MASNATAISTLQTAHTNAEVGGVASGSLPGVVTPLGNATGWSRYSARAAYAAGSITQGQFVNIMNALANYEQTQYEIARDSESITGVLPQ